MSDPGTSDEDARMTEGVWQPLPHGAEYDADQTMHVSFAAHLQLDEPAADAPAATWTIPTVEDSDPAAEDSGEYSAGMVPAARNGGEWALPFAADDNPEETGEYPFPEPEPVAEEVHSDHPLASYVLRVNGADRPVTDAWLGESLLYVLRERLGLMRRQGRLRTGRMRGLLRPGRRPPGRLLPRPRRDRRRLPRSAPSRASARTAAPPTSSAPSSNAAPSSAASAYPASP